MSPICGSIRPKVNVAMCKHCLACVLCSHNRLPLFMAKHTGTLTYHPGCGGEQDLPVNSTAIRGRPSGPSQETTQSHSAKHTDCFNQHYGTWCICNNETFNEMTLLNPFGGHIMKWLCVWRSPVHTRINMIKRVKNTSACEPVYYEYR
jgi:hypothetical protein